MYSTVQSESVFFLASLISGIALAFLYDILRISRRIVAVNDVIINGQDILFFAACAVMFFYVAYLKNGGEVRLSGFLGGFLGIILYAILVRNRFLNLGETAVKWLIKTAVLLFKIVMMPVGILFRALKKPVLVIAWYTGRVLKRARRTVRCQKARAKMRVLSAWSLRKKK